MTEFERLLDQAQHAVVRASDCIDAGDPEQAEPQAHAALDCLKAAQVLQALPLTALQLQARASRLLGDVSRAHGKHKEAQAKYEEALQLSGSIRAQEGDTPEALREVSISLDRLGLIAEAQGHLDEARSRFEAKLQLDEQIRALVGDTPEALREVSISLDRLGLIAEAQGHLDEARTRFEAKLQLDEQIRALVGDTPEALRGLSISLERLGDLARTEGRLDEARARFEAMLQLDEQIRALVGDTPQALRDLSISLGRVGALARTQGRLDEARSRFEALLVLAEQIRACVGDTPEALRDLSKCLGRLGDLAETQGRLDEARSRFEAKLEVDEQIRTLVGDTPESLRDLLSSLGHLGDLHCTQGRLDEALARFEALHHLAKQIRALVGDTPQALRHLSICLGRLGDLAKTQGDLDEARSRFEAKLLLDQQIRAQVGDTHEALSDMSVCLGRLGELAQTQGHLDEARSRYEAKLQLLEQIRAREGDTHWVLDCLSSRHHDLGSLAQTQGRMGEAQTHFEASRQLAAQLRDQGGDAEGAGMRLARSLGGLGKIAEAQGRQDEANSLREAQLKLQYPVDDLPEGLRGESIRLSRRGFRSYFMDQLEDARSLFEARFRLTEQIRVRVGDTLETLRDVANSLGDLGMLAQSQGHLDEARPRFEAQLQLYEQVRVQAGDTPETLRDVAKSLKDLGDLARRQGLLDEARSRFEAQLQLYEQVRARTPRMNYRNTDLFNELSSLEALGDLAKAQGRLDEARTCFEARLHLAEEMRARKGDTSLTLLFVRLSLLSLGDLARTQGRLDEARSHYEAMLQLTEQISAREGSTPEALCDLSFSHDRLGNLAETQSRLAEAAEHHLKAAKLRLRAAVPRGEKSLMHFANDAEKMTALSRKGVQAEEDLWPLYEQTQPFISLYTEFNDPQSLDRARPMLERFHSAWLLLALQTSAERLPEVLGASQGRKITSLAVNELHRQVHSSALASLPEFDAFMSAREKVHQLEVELARVAQPQAANSNRRSLEREPESAEAARNRAEDQRKQRDDLWSQHRMAMQAYRAAHDALKAIRPELADIAPPPADRYSLQNLQLKLAQPHRALLLLVQSPADEDDATLAEPPTRTHALLLPHEGAPTLLALPGLDEFPGRVHDWRESLDSGHRSGAALRDCQGWQRSSIETSSADPEDVEPIDVEQALRALLWAALVRPDAWGRSLLNGVSELHVVSHGALHGLPLALGAPDGMVVSQYPGLVNFWLVHERQDEDALRVSELDQLDMQIYSPQAGESAHEALTPIPYVQAEAHLAGGCWQPRDTTRPATVMHLACHGTLEREGQEDPCLVLSSTSSMNLLELLDGAPSAPIVFLSACLVGRTREDGDGDPLGLVTGFFVRGARCVIAALNPISDFHAPLLGYLFHRTLQAQAQQQGRLQPVLALADAKQQVQSGCWVPQIVQAQSEPQRQAWEHDSVHAVQQAYAAQMQQLLQQALTKPGTGHELPWAQRTGEQVREGGRWNGQIKTCLAAWGLPELLDSTDNTTQELIAILMQQRQPSCILHPDSAGQLLAHHLVGARATLHHRLLPLQLLLQDMQAFGAVE